DKEHVNRILDSFGFDPVIGISVLIEKSLITVSKKRLEMHDLIQEMGCQIVRDFFTNSRIWELEEMQNRIIQKTKLKSVEVIVLRDYEYNVDLYDKKLTSSSVACIVACHRRLVYLDMSGYSKLKYLPSIMEMQSLETLILSNCSSLKRFPKVSPCMVKLSKMYLDHCNRIKDLPSSFRYLSGLSFISLVSCAKLKKIRLSICELRNLKSLYLHDCKKLEELPEEVGSMENLEELLFGFRYKLAFKSTPESSKFHTFIGLYSLRKLDLRCRQIEEKNFPPNFHAFPSWEELNLSGNSELTQLPTGISQLSNLKILELNECSRLQVLDNLPLRI
ncbi:TMV resistance protein N-like protein, partial [Tanacetum coccineum]